MNFFHRFKIKYHPEESVARKEEQLASLKVCHNFDIVLILIWGFPLVIPMLSFVLQNRLNVFLELLEQGELDKVSVDVDKTEKLIRLLDTVVIKLEGGTDEDLKALDEPVSRPVDANEKSGKCIMDEKYFYIVIFDINT